MQRSLGKFLFSLLTLAILSLNGAIARAESDSLPLAQKNIGEIQKFEVEIENSTFYRLGDMIVDESLVVLPSAKSISPALDPLKGAKPNRVTLWEDGVLPISFKDDVNGSLQMMVMEACAEWSRAANVKCVPAPYKGRTLTISRHYFGNSEGCWSMLGSSRYFLNIKRRINFGQYCESYPIVLHELGHALGLTHEHQRSDRDAYVEILKDNIYEPFAGFGYKLNFAAQETQNLTPYDFLSIMHYRRDGASKNGHNTIVPRPGYELFMNQMGNQEHLSKNDIISIEMLYGPPIKK